MKLLSGTVLDFETSGEEGKDCSISAASTALMFEILSSQIYSNPIGSMIREITSNCFDSHTEAGVDDAVIVRYIKEENVGFISFVDVGVGLSPERMDKVYSNYLESTKRLSNEQLGMWGLGSKSPLAYQDSFQVITRFEGIEYFYIVHKGEKGIPRIEKMYEMDTEERNGTEIKVQLKGRVSTYSNPNDYWKFQDEIKKQLCYFDNVYYEGWDIDNGYSLYEGETFLYRNTDQYSEELHIILGKVAYPIDWHSVGMKRVEMPLGIKIGIGEVQVTPSRESLKYSDETKALIKEKVLATLEEVKQMYNTQRGEMTLFQFLETRRSKRLSYFNIGGNRIKIHGIEKDELDSFSIPEYKGVIPENPFMEFYIGKYIGDKGKVKFEVINVDKAIFEEASFRIMRLKGDLSNKEKNFYIDDRRGWAYMLERKQLSLRMMMKRLELPIKLGAYEVKRQIELYRKTVTKLIIDRYDSYDKLEVPKEWITALRENRKQEYLNAHTRRKVNKQFLVHILEERGYRSDSKTAWEKKDWSTENLKEHIHPNTTLIYGILEQKNDMKSLYAMLNGATKNKTMFVITAKSNVENLDERPNSYRMEDVIKGKFRTIKRVVTAKAIADYKTEPMRMMQHFMPKLFEKVAADMDKLDTIIKSGGTRRYDDEFTKEVMELATMYNLVDTEVLSTAKKIANYFDNMPLLNFIKYEYEYGRVKYPDPTKFIPAVIEYMKFKKKKLNPIHYFIPTEQELRWTTEPSIATYESLTRTKHRKHYAE